MNDFNADLLQRYDRYKLELADEVRISLEHAKESAYGDIIESLKAVLARLAAGQFNLAFVGQFSRGKSTVMNALIGQNLLPVGVVPVTSVVTMVKYGSRSRVVIRFANSLLTREIEISELPQYVAQTGNPGNVRGLQVAEIQTPCDLLLRGACLVDTPGIGSSIVENTSTTQRFLPEVDAFVVVTAVDSPVTQEECQLLQNAVDRGKKVFLVLNKADLLRDDDLLQATNYVREVAADISPTIQVYALSAQNHLRSGAADNSDDKGWLTFESELRTFLAQDRAAPFLLNNCDRVIAALRSPNGLPGSSDVLKRVEKIRVDVARAAAKPADTAQSVVHSVSWQSTCFVCAGAAARVFDFLSQYQYAITADPDTRNRHARINGFCDLHTWQYEKIASPRGICTAYPPLLRRAAEMLGRSTEFSPGCSCPACEVQDSAERELLQTMASRVDDDRGVQLLCIPHLKFAVRFGYDARANEFATSLSATLTHMAETMQRFSMKQVALRRDLQSEEEQRVHRRALALLVGQPQIKTGN